MGYHDDIVPLLSSMSIAALAAEFKKADDAYRKGEPLMSDSEFDRLEDELRQAAPHHPALSPDGVVMLSLENNRRRSFEEWYETLPPKTSLVVQPKIDGISLGLRYVNGELSEAQTRKGRCALDVARLVPSIPRQIKTDEPFVEVHGELYGIDKLMPSQQWAARSLRVKKPNGDGLLFCAYRVIGSLTNESRSREDLHRFGFEVPDTIFCTKPSEVVGLYEKWLERKIFNSWPTDGVVVKVYDQRLQRKLGVNSVAPRWAMALKRWPTLI